MKGKDFKSNSNLFFNKGNQNKVTSIAETDKQDKESSVSSFSLANYHPPTTSTSNNLAHDDKLNVPEKDPKALSLNSLTSSDQNRTQNFVQNKFKNMNSFNSIMVHPCQKGNPLISHIRNSPWSYADISGVEETSIPDYQPGRGIAVLFLSIKYHKLHPEYIYRRLNGLKASTQGNSSKGALGTTRSGYKLVVVLIWVDVPDHHESLKELHRISITSSVTLFLCWTPDEAAKYIEAFRKLESKSPDSIMERGTVVGEGGAYIANLTDSLTKLRSVNKTDVMTLAANFPNFKSLVQATPEKLSLCPGLGEKKVVQLSKAFTQPFFAK